MPLHREQRVQLLIERGLAKAIKLILLDILVIVSIKLILGWETQNHTVGKGMSPTDELLVVL